MASTTLNRAGTAGDAPRPFGPSDAAEMRRSAGTARAVCRVVALAVDAQLDGAVNFQDRTPTRWWSSIDVARENLERARDVLIETSGAPESIDWAKPLCLVEALSAAMWHSHSVSNTALDHIEIAAFLAAAIESIDAFLRAADAAESHASPLLN